MLVVHKPPRANTITGLGENAVWLDYNDLRAEVSASPLRTWLKYNRRPATRVVLLEFHAEILPLKTILLVITIFLRSPKSIADVSGRQIDVTFAFLARYIFVDGVWRGLVAMHHFREITSWVSKHRNQADEPVARIAPLRAGYRVLFVRVDFWFGLKVGGSFSHMRGIMAAFKEASVDVVYCGNEELEQIKDLVSEQDVCSPEYCPFISLEMNQVVYNEHFGEHLRRLLETYHFDLIYIRHSMFHFRTVDLARRYGVPLILECNDLVNIGRPAEWRLARLGTLAEELERYVLEHATIVSPISALLAQNIRKLGVAQEKIVVTPNGVDLREFDDQRCQSMNPILVKRSTIRVGFVGTFAQFHGVDIVPECASQVLAVHRDVEFVLVGDGRLRPGLERAILEKGIADRVFLPGLVPHREIPAFLSSCDILISPHRGFSDVPFFGSPTKLFEYMAAGQAIVASNLDTIADVLDGGLLVEDLRGPIEIGEAPGVLVAAGDARQLAQAIVFLVEHPDIRHQLGHNARARVEDGYTWSRSIGILLERLDQLREEI